MFLTKVQRSTFYQLVYEVDGKQKTISTKVSLLPSAQNFLASFLAAIKTEDYSA